MKGPVRVVLLQRLSIADNRHIPCGGGGDIRAAGEYHHVFFRLEIKGEQA